MLCAFSIKNGLKLVDIVIMPWRKVNRSKVHQWRVANTKVALFLLGIKIDLIVLR